MNFSNSGGRALNNRVLIAVKPTSATPEPDIPKREAVETPASNWGIMAAILLAAMPHLWQWLAGHQKARNTLTETLLQKLTDSYQLASTSNEAFRAMIERIAERPTELAESNSRALRDLLSEVADLRGQLIELNKRIERLASIITREAQK
jgi:hypothetical protein